MGEALATRQSNCATASTKSHAHLQKVSGSTPPANEQRVFCPVYSFKNIRAQRRCSSLPSLGKSSIVSNIDHSVRKISTPQPKKCQNSISSVAIDLSLSGWQFHICLACHKTSSLVGFVYHLHLLLLLFLLHVLSAWMSSSSSAIMLMLLCVCANKEATCGAQWDPPMDGSCFNLVVTMFYCWIANPIMEAKTTT